MNKKQIISLWIGGFSVGILLLVVFLIYPLLSDIQKGSNQIIVARASMVTTELEARELARFEKNYKDYEPNFKKADVLKVDAKDPIDFIKFLEKIETESGVTLDIMLIPTQGQKLGAWPALVFSVQVNGSFSGVMAFSKKVETGPYITAIQKLSVQKHRETVDNKNASIAGAVDADMLLRVATQ